MNIVAEKNTQEVSLDIDRNTVKEKDDYIRNNKAERVEQEYIFFRARANSKETKYDDFSDKTHSTVDGEEVESSLSELSTNKESLQEHVVVEPPISSLMKEIETNRLKGYSNIFQYKGKSGQIMKKIEELKEVERQVNARSDDNLTRDLLLSLKQNELHEKEYSLHRKEKNLEEKEKKINELEEKLKAREDNVLRNELNLKMILEELQTRLYEMNW